MSQDFTAEQPVLEDAETAVFNARSIMEQLHDLNVLAAIAIPKVMAFLFPPMFVYFWKKCTTLASGTAGFPKFALGIPRGHGKTIFLKLLIVWIILFTRRRFILVIAASESLAEAILADVIDILDSDNIRKLFGDWDSQVTYNRNGAKSFYFRGRSIILKAKGQGSSFRGVAEKLARPDVMIFDDAQTAECAASSQQAMEFINWFRGTAMKAKDPKFCFFLYVGNMYRKLIIKEASRREGRAVPPVYACNLRNLKESKHWESLIVGAILQDGSALWEELQPLTQLLAEYAEDVESGTEEVFLAEVMNDDDAYNSRLFDPGKIIPFPYHEETIPQGACLIIDPSLGKTTSDEQIVGLIHYIDGRPCIMETRKFQVSAPMLVRQCIDWCLEEQIPAIVVESYAYQQSLCQWFEHFLVEDGIEGINVLEIARGARSKVSAILSGFKMMMDSEILLGPLCRSEIIAEAKNFDPLKTDNIDNRLDIVAYAPEVLLKYKHEIATYLHTLYTGKTKGHTKVIDRGLTWGVP